MKRRNHKLSGIIKALTSILLSTGQAVLKFYIKLHKGYHYPKQSGEKSRNFPGVVPFNHIIYRDIYYNQPAVLGKWITSH